MTITEAEYLEMKIRCDRKLGRLPPEEDHQADPGPEDILAGKIMKWCHDRGYPCQCFRKSIKAKGFLVPGWPD